MESHPVPKNVLTVEFKLFGPLTISQFFKILVPALLALGIFAFTPASLRFFVALPIGVVIVLLGVGSALLDGFEVKMWGVIKAMFTNTQYVWKKDTDVPKVLTEEKQPENIEPRQKAETARPDLDDISIDRLLNARREQRQEPATPPAQNDSLFGNAPVQYATNNDSADISSGDQVFDNFYAQQFGKELSKKKVTQSSLANNGKPGAQVAMGKNLQTNLRNVNNSGPRAEITPGKPVEVKEEEPEDKFAKQQKIAELTAQINELRGQLRTTDIEKRKQVTQQIKELFDQLQILAGRKKEEVVRDERTLFGVVIGKKDEPVAGAQIEVMSIDGTNKLTETTTTGDGRFSIDVKALEKSEYGVKINHPNFNFPIFKVNLNQQNLPGYKFRAA